LADGWRMTSAKPGDGWVDHPQISAQWSPVRLGSFAAMGLPEDAHASFFRSVPVPAKWAGQRIHLVFDTENWFWGLNSQARIWINGEPLLVPEYAPASEPARTGPLLLPQPAGSFNIDVTDRVRGGTLDLAISIDGSSPDPKARHPRPAGVTGLFYLQPEPKPADGEALTDWSAATDVNVLTPAPAGKPAHFTYLENHFTLPAKWRGKRLFLRSPDASLNLLVINNVVVLVPQSMDRLDVSKLFHPDGVNIIRWLPGGCSGFQGGWPKLPRFDVVVSRVVPTMRIECSTL